MFDKINIFTLVVELGSFAEAAKTLRMAPSSVGRMIDSLEADLGVVLFKRTTRRLTVTSAGREFYDKARRACRMLAEAKEAARAHGARRHLTVNVFESFGSAVVTPALVRLLQVDPSLSVSLRFDGQLRPLSQASADVFIRLSAPSDSNFKIKRLCRNDFRLYASPVYLAERGTPQSPSELAQHNVLTYDRLAKGTLHFKKGKQMAKVQVDGNFSAVGSTPLYRAASANLGIALLPSWRLPAEDALTPVLPDWEIVLPGLGRGFVHAIYPQELAGNREVASLFKAIDDVLQGKLPKIPVL